VDYADVDSLLDLHRELWWDHDQRGGLPSAYDEDTWERYRALLGLQLGGTHGKAYPDVFFDGRLAHLVAENDGEVVAQIESLVERPTPRAPLVADLRSLIVAPKARRMGAARALIAELARAVLHRGGADSLLSAEVLAANDAVTFYIRLGFRVVDHVIAMAERAMPAATMEAKKPDSLRVAESRDAYAILALEHAHRVRQKQWGDPRIEVLPNTNSRRIDEQARIDADCLRLNDEGRSTAIFVAKPDPIATGTVTVHPLGIPFAPVFRSELSRFYGNIEHPEGVLQMVHLAHHGFAFAQSRGAKFMLIRVPMHDPVGKVLLEQPSCQPFSRILIAKATTVLDLI
jgi:ribosomal protein S18 acetylase RimI-like enzyme